MGQDIPEFPLSDRLNFSFILGFILISFEHKNFINKSGTIKYIIFPDKQTIAD